MLRFGARLWFARSGKRFGKSNSLLVPVSLPTFRFNHSETQSSTSLSFDKIKESPHLVSLLNSTRDLGFDENEIKLVIEKQPDLLMRSPTLWSNVLTSFLDCGMEKTIILSIITQWPEVFSLKKDVLNRNLQAWFLCNLDHNTVFDVWHTHPSILKVNHLTVLKRVKQYQSYFATKRGIGKLLLLAPNTIDEDWPQLLDKLNYLNELCTEKQEILRTGVLAKTALHIRTRHEFLIRAGIYKRPGKEYNKNLCKNPKLSSIVNSSDREFVSMAGLTLLEYEVFCDMYEKEDYETKNTEEYDSEDEELDLCKQTKRKPSRR